jgi:hypothetical protein
MPQPVADTPDLTPLNTRDLFRKVPKADCGFADDLQFAFYGGNGFRILAKGSKVHFGGEAIYHSDRVSDIPQERFG